VIGGSALSIAIDGYRMQGLLHAVFTGTNCFSSDTFSLTFAIGPAPLHGLEFWSTLTSAYVEVSVSVDAGTTTIDVISGMVDNTTINPILKTVVIEGRDLSASLIDSYRQQDFVNQTASEVISTIAQYHGLTAIASKTNGNVGRYYVDGYTRLSLGQFSRLRSDWDLVVQLARENEFDAFVTGRSLYFQSIANRNEISVRIDKGDVQRMTVERALNIGAAASARVQSWNSQNMVGYNSGAQDIASGGQTYLFSSPNFTSDQVTAAATRYASELVRLSTILNIDMPRDFSYSPRTEILLTGTNSSLDTTYIVDSVERHYDARSGSTQSIRAIKTD